MGNNHYTSQFLFYTAEVNLLTATVKRALILSTTIPSPCYCVKHKFGRVTSRIEMAREEFYNEMSVQVKKTRFWHTFQDVTVPNKKKSIQSNIVIRVERQVRYYIHIKAPTLNAECSVKRNSSEIGPKFERSLESTLDALHRRTGFKDSDLRFQVLSLLNARKGTSTSDCDHFKELSRMST
jgi:hypothetical protein